MERKIRIRIGALEFPAGLNETRIAGLIWEALPITASFNLWGDEIYFPVPVEENRMENPRATVDPGDLGYYSNLIASFVFSRRLDSFLA